MALPAHPVLCAILGHPVGHSLSPAIHNAGYEALGLGYLYVAHDVAPGDLGPAISGARALGYRGLSVTIPHKVAAMDHVGYVDPTARRIGCVNTIVNRGGELCGYNTDGLGALEALRAHDVDPSGQRVVVLGSGGAARAITVTFAAEAAPSHISLLGIDQEELRRLETSLRELETSNISVHQLDQTQLARELANASLLLQTTPIGMAPRIDASLVPPELLHTGLTVFDAVYTPRRTRLLSDAYAAGARIVPGLEMFLRQALLQFRLFTQVEPPVEVMRAVLEQNLGQE